MKSEYVKPYIGNKPYIFISYAHKDSQRVMPIVQQLSSQGVRCWYDEGIAPGSEWDENIANNLNQSGYFFAFITQNYMDSHNCQDELHYALDTGKPCLLIYLDQIKLPAGKEMRLSRIQAIEWFRYRDKKIAFEKLFQTQNMSLFRDDVKDCLEEEITEREKDSRSIAWKDKIKYGVVALAVLLAVGVGWKEKSDSKTIDSATNEIQMLNQTDNTQDIISSEEVSNLTPFPEEIDICFSAPDGMTLTGFNQAVETIRERMDILVGEGSYDFESDGETIRFLSVPISVFGSLPIDTICRIFISRSGQVCLYDSQADPGDFETADHVYLSEADVESAEIVYGTIPGFEENEETQILQILLTGNFLAENAALIQSWTELKYGLDVNLNEWHSCDAVYFDAELGKLLVYDSCNEQVPALELLRYSLIHPYLEDSFESKTDIIAEWEKIVEENSPGTLQCTVDEIVGGYVTMEFSCAEDEISPGEWVDTKAYIKQRLDSLGQPYAFGYGQEDNSIVIRTGTAHLGEKLAETLGEKYLHLTVENGKSEYTYYYYESSSSVSEGIFFEDEYSCQIDFQESYQKDELDSFKSEVDADGSFYVFLGEEYLPQVSFEFTDSGFVLKVPAEYSWLLSYLMSVATQDLPIGLSLSRMLVSYEDFNSEEETSTQWGISNDSETSVLNEKVAAVGPEFAAYIDGKSVSVALHLPVNENLPADGIAYAKEVWSAIDFMSGPYEQLNVYLVDEDDESHERARIYFDKNYIRYDSETGDFYYEDLHISGIFCNGRLSNYTDAFIEAIQSDDFINKYSDTTTTAADWNYVFNQTIAGGICY